LVEFIGDAPLVIHNAEFDVRFLNAEFQRLARPPLGGERVVDTLQMARQRNFPGRRPASMRCAGASPSTIRPGPSMARSSIRAPG
jgi:DNA polymerase-3 subunit epsilon